jgi:hypothetical protein
MISNELKLIFLHPNKCGGKSIEKALWGVEPVPGSADHRTMQMHLHEDKERALTYFKFMFCRNPWDRLVSIYHGRQQILKTKMPTFEKFIRIIDPKKRPGLLQTTWIKTNLGIQVDFIGRFERYEEDWNRLNLGISLPHVNKSKHKSYEDLYSRELINIVAKKYEEDIDFFGYQFDGFCDENIDSLTNSSGLAFEPR